MSDLGHVIALLLGAHERYLTVRATLSVRYEARKLRRQHGDLGEAPDVRDDLPETEPRAREGVVRVWLAPPDQIREEREGDLGGWRLGIRGGGNWWALDDEGDAYSNEEEPEVDTDIGESTRLFFDPRPLVGALDLELLGETEIAGRAAIRLRGTRRPAQLPTELEFELHLTGDEFELDVDAERGVLLRKATGYGGVESSVEEVLEIAFDETFPPETFAPTDVPVRPDAEPRELSLREAAELVAFPVRTPPPLAEEWSLHTSYFPGDARALEPEAIILELLHDDSRHVWIAQTAAGQPSQIESDRRWQTNHYEGHEYEVVSPEPRNGMQACVRFEQGGTRILISSRDFGLDALLEVAAAFARVDELSR